jgi:hypothetical protein
MSFTAQQVINSLTPAELQIWNGLSTDQKNVILSDDNYPNIASIKGFLDTKTAKNIVSQNTTTSTKPVNTLNDDNSSTVTTQSPTDAPTIFVPLPNILRPYASYSPILSLLVTNTLNYNKMITATSVDQKYIASDWQLICKSGGVGKNKAVGFSGENTAYFSPDMYIDDATVNIVVGMSQENRGSNATDIELNIIEPYGMDFIEQLYDYCNTALGENNYCQIPYMLKIEFKGYKDDGTIETVPDATKYIPISLNALDIKVNNMGAIYKLSAIALNELSNSEIYGRVPTNIQLGSYEALNAEITQSAQSGDTTDIQNIDAAITPALQGNGLISDIIKSFMDVLNNIQKRLFDEGSIDSPDIYSVTFPPIETPNGTIDQSLYLDLSTLSGIPVTAKDNSMGTPIINNNQFNIPAYTKNTNLYAPDAITGKTPNGSVTYGDQLISFSSGSSILDCLNTLLVNSNYITTQINQYNNQIKNINTLASAANLQIGAPIPTMLQTLLYELDNTTLYWFVIVPSTTYSTYDHLRGRYSRFVNFTIQPYKIYNARSISVPNDDPISNNRVVKEYDYIFTGKNTEIITFDLNFNNAFYTYAQFNHDTKGQATGTSSPAKQVAGADVPPIKNLLSMVSSPTNSGQSIQFVSSSSKTAIGTGAQTPERNQASDVVSTIYAVGEQIQLDMTIYGDPDFIRQDGIFYNPLTTHAFSTNPRGILFNSGEVYANVNFKIPQDINLNTGTLDLSFEGSPINYKRNVFSGQYKIFSVTNKFNRALFTQQISMYRYVDHHNFDLSERNSQDIKDAVSRTAQQNAIPPELKKIPVLPPNTINAINTTLTVLKGLPLP